MEWEAINVKLLNEFTRAMAEATKNGKKIRKVWMTTSISIVTGFVERYLLPPSGGYGISSKSDGL